MIRGSAFRFCALCAALTGAACDGASVDNAANATDTPRVEDPRAADTAGAAGQFAADTTVLEPEEGGPAAGDATTRPAQVLDTIRLEGMPEPISLDLYHADLPDPIDFSIYVPEEMIVEKATTAEGTSIRVIAAFGGQRNDNAYLSFFFLPPGTSEQAARDRTARVSASHGLVPRDADEDDEIPFDDALIEYHAPPGCPGGECTKGWSTLIRHGDRFAQVLLVYPIVYAEGLGPRVRMILNSLRWADEL